MVMICMCLPQHIPSHTHTPLPSHSHAHTPTSVSLAFTLLPPTHTAFLQWKNLISQTNPSLPRLSPTINEAIVEPTALRVAESVHPQPYPSGELRRAKESEWKPSILWFLHDLHTCKSDDGFSVGHCINTFALMTTGVHSVETLASYFPSSSWYR